MVNQTGSFNKIKLNENLLRLEILAVGICKANIDVYVENEVLYIKGRHNCLLNEQFPKHNIEYNGLILNPIDLKFKLNRNQIIEDCVLSNGILYVDILTTERSYEKININTI